MGKYDKCFKKCAGFLKNLEKHLIKLTKQAIIRLLQRNLLVQVVLDLQ